MDREIVCVTNVYFDMPSLAPSLGQLLRSLLQSPRTQKRQPKRPKKCPKNDFRQVLAGDVSENPKRRCSKCSRTQKHTKQSERARKGKSAKERKRAQQGAKKRARKSAQKGRFRVKIANKHCQLFATTMGTQRAENVRQETGTQA